MGNDTESKLKGFSAEMRPRILQHLIPEEEHRGSRALDADFREAAASGFAPLTEEAKAAFKAKAEGFAAVIHGGRR